MRKIPWIALNPLIAAAYARQEWLYWSYLHSTLPAQDFARRYSLTDQTSGRVLDWGCGRGRHVAMLSRLGFQVTGVDTTEHRWWLRLTRSRLYTCAGVYLPEPPESFNICLSILVLSLVPDAQGMLTEIHRLLRPGGVLALQVPNQDNLYTQRTGRPLNDYEPVQRYYKTGELEAAVRAAGLIVARTWTEGFYPSRGLAVSNAVLGLLPEAVYRWLGNLLPPENRGVINLIARKPW